MNEMKYPKVLIISHNPFSTINNMGKTLAAYFSCFPKECIAQLYLHEGKPDSNVCNNYYSFSDKDALKSVFLRFHKGSVYKNENFVENRYELNDGIIYKLKREKNPIIYFARDIVWRFSNVFNRKLFNWIEEFKPELIFYASGEYSFSYRIALKISKKYNIPLTTCCFDDFYFQCQYKNKFLGKLYYNRFMKISNNIIKNSKSLYAVNDYMAEKYAEFFNKKFHVIYTACTNKFHNIPFENKCGISYIGGLTLGRLEEIIKLGEAVSILDDDRINKINVYSVVNDSNIINLLNNSKGVIFHGSINAEEVCNVIDTSIACLHLESFSEEFIYRTKYSLSTKISDVIGSNTLLIAYGPYEIASMKYIVDNNIGIFSDDINDFVLKLKKIIENKNEYFYYIKCSNKIACKNHDARIINELFLQSLIDSLK